MNTAKLKAAAQEEMELRQVGDTSDNWQDLATPQAFLELIAALEAALCANAAQDDHINQQQDRIDKLEKGHEEAAKQISSWRRLAKQNIAEREKDIAALGEARQRLANAEHQLHIAELAKHNLRASRKAQFRKRKAAEARVTHLEARTLRVNMPALRNAEMMSDLAWNSAIDHCFDALIKATDEAGINLETGGEA
ncbi:hypothetical protein ACSDIA_003753 [Cronobacter turicensis]